MNKLIGQLVEWTLYPNSVAVVTKYDKDTSMMELLYTPGNHTETAHASECRIVEIISLNDLNKLRNGK
ncbi:MAG: hypothetical protein ACRDDZ_01425 [Marinifilaceae bacterium]